MHCYRMTVLITLAKNVENGICPIGIMLRDKYTGIIGVATKLLQSPLYEPLVYVSVHHCVWAWHVILCKMAQIWFYRGHQGDTEALSLK